jgi:hypothetical protein
MLYLKCKKKSPNQFQSKYDEIITRHILIIFRNTFSTRGLLSFFFLNSVAIWKESQERREFGVVRRKCSLEPGYFFRTNIFYFQLEILFPLKFRVLHGFFYKSLFTIYHLNHPKKTVFLSTVWSLCIVTLNLLKNATGGVYLGSILKFFTK